MTRDEWKSQFRARLSNAMGLDSTTEVVTLDSAQRFGEFVVKVNGKKHRNGDRIIIRIGRGTTAKNAEWRMKTVLLIDDFDPISKAKEVARYLRLRAERPD